MSEASSPLSLSPLGGFSLGLPTHGYLLAAIAAPIFLSGMLVDHPVGAAALFLVGMTLAALAVGIALIGRSAKAGRAARASVLAQVHERDPNPCVVTDGEGTVLTANPAAWELAGANSAVEAVLQSVLDPVYAVPDMAQARLREAVLRAGYVKEKLGADGPPRVLSVLNAGDDLLVWRIEQVEQDFSHQTWRDGLPFALISVDEDGEVFQMNRAARELLGGRRDALEDVVGEVFTGSGVYGIETAQGARDVALYVATVADGRREIMLLDNVAQPAEPVKVTQNNLNAIPIALVRLTRTGRILDANEPARSLLGAEAVPGAHLSRLVEGLGRPVRDWLDDVVAGRAPPRPEMVQIQNREDVFVQIALNPVRGDDEAAVVAVLTDATELKNLEAQFVQSQKMQAIGQLAGGVAHDFNNLLTAISGHCDLLLMRHDRGDPDYGDLVQINQNTNRAASLVGQLLAFSRKQTMQLEAIDLRDTIGELIHLLNRLVGEKVRLTLSHGSELPLMRADKRQLEQVLMNLVVNARDAMPNGGSITIETAGISYDQPMPRSRVVVPPGDYVAITVRDEGHGIPPEKCAKIFEPFYTTKRMGEGTGLGLSTAYGIVKQTGGYIFVDSEVGKGAAFTLLFPAFSEEMTADPETVAETPQTTADPTSSERRSDDGVVLLVEDEAPVRAFASRALRMRGYTVLEAENAEEALSTLSDPALEVDVFVTDVVMPGMDGPTWVREARKARPEVRVVFVSGYAEDSFNDANEDIPNSVFLPKPFSLSELTSMVRGQMH